MEKKLEYLILFFLVIFSIYCSLILGMAWDEPYYYEMGKNRLKYVLSFGNYEYRDFSHFSNAPQFPGFYDTLTAFISQMIPIKYEIQMHHNLTHFSSDPECQRPPGKHVGCTEQVLTRKTMKK